MGGGLKRKVERHQLKEPGAPPLKNLGQDIPRKAGGATRAKSKSHYRQTDVHCLSRVSGECHELQVSL